MTDLDQKRLDRLKQLDKLGKPPAWWRLIRLRRWLRQYRSIMALSLDEWNEAMRGLYSTVSFEDLASREHVTLSTLRRMPKHEGEP